MDDKIEQKIKERALFSNLIRLYPFPAQAVDTFIGALLDLDDSTNADLFNSDRFAAASAEKSKVCCLFISVISGYCVCR